MSQNPDDLPNEGVTLDELSAAFRQAMGYAPPPGAPPPGVTSGPALPAEAAGPQASEPPQAADEPADDPCPITPESLLEAMLFVGNREGQPLPARRAAELMRGIEPEEIGDLVEQLNYRYRQRGCPYHVISEGAGYRLTLRPDYAALRDRFYGRIREARLSQAAIDVLAIVAYRQPITAQQVTEVRSRPANRLLAQLVRRRLLRIERTDDGTPQYLTAPRFLELFGLQSLDELPQSEELG